VLLAPPRNRGTARPFAGLLASRRLVAALCLAITALAVACSSSGSSQKGSQRSVRIGLFPNVTHAPGILCYERGAFEAQLRSESRPGRDRGIEVKLFDSGPQAIEAIFSGAIDIAYIGPGPALNGFLRSQGQALRIVAGATSGGASFVVQPEIASVFDLAGKVIATPQLGNTQDIAARAWLKRNGFKTDPAQGGDVTIAPRPNPQIVDAFRNREIAGAWVPEPWASRLVVEYGGKVLVDERELWPKGLFSTTVVVATPAFIQSDLDALVAILVAHLQCIDSLNSSDLASVSEARRSVETWLGRTVGKSLPKEVTERAWSELTFTADPLLDTIVQTGAKAVEEGLLPPFDNSSIEGFVDPRPLDRAYETIQALSQK